LKDGRYDTTGESYVIRFPARVPVTAATVIVEYIASKLLAEAAAGVPHKTVVEVVHDAVLHSSTPILADGVASYAAKLRPDRVAVEPPDMGKLPPLGPFNPAAVELTLGASNVNALVTSVPATAATVTTAAP
jgi:hypothetical protein